MNSNAVAKELRTRLALDHRSEGPALLARHCLEQSAREGSKPSEDAGLTSASGTGLGPNQAFTPARPGRSRDRAPARARVRRELLEHGRAPRSHD
jgi:hypothetical protein